MRDIGKNIREARIRRGWTQEEMAERLYCTRQTVSNYEQGRSRPDVETLTKIAEVLGTDATELIYGTSSQNARRRDTAVLAAALCLCVILFAAYFFAVRQTLILKSTSYIVLPYVLTMVFGKALAAIVLGWTFMQVVRLVAGYRPPEGTKKTQGRAAALALTAAGVLWLIMIVLAWTETALPGLLSVPFHVFYRISAMHLDALRLVFWFMAGCMLRYFELPPVSSSPDREAS